MKTNSTFHLFILFVVIFFSPLAIIADDPSPWVDIGCKLLFCGEGTCGASKVGSLLPVDCDCKPGYKKITVGDTTLPPCILPNCTLDFGCGTNSPPSAPAPPPPPFDLNNPCTISWCGEGSCVRNGSVANCHCNAGSDNLMGLKTFPCFKECNFGGDCKDFGFGNSASSPPPPPPPSSSNSGSSKNGTSFVPPPSPNMGLGGQTQLGGIAAPNSSTARHAMTLLMLAAIVLSLF